MTTETAEHLLPAALAVVQLYHDDYIARNQAVFRDFPPGDRGVYVYTYYDGNGYPLYHGYTTERAETHLDRAPWALLGAGRAVPAVQEPAAAKAAGEQAAQQGGVAVRETRPPRGRLVGHRPQVQDQPRDRGLPAACGACDTAQISRLLADARAGAS